jgi:hypothetical protein
VTVIDLSYNNITDEGARSILEVCPFVYGYV